MLAKGQSAVPQPGDAATNAAGAGATTTSDSGLYTLIVPVTAARWIAAGSDGVILTLVAQDYTPKAPETLNTKNGLPGSDPNQLTPYGKNGAEASN